MLASTKPGRRSWTIRTPLWIGLAALIGLLGSVVAWAVVADISGAVIGEGQVQASANRIAVQHPVGGVAAEILVNNGDRVNRGDILVKLDNSSRRSELAAVESELFELLANEARLEAELEGRRSLSLHPLLQESLTNNAGLRSLLNQQQRQLDDHYRSLGTQVSVLQRQGGQITDEAGGVRTALAAKREELALLEEEHARATQSLRNGYVTRSVVTSLQRDVLRARGEVGVLEARFAELRQRSAEQRARVYASPLDTRRLSAERLNLSRQRSRTLIESRNGLVENLRRLEVRAPVSGMVFDSRILGPRSVIEAARPIMYIVPNNRRNMVVVRVAAEDIEQVHVGQTAGLRFRSFNRRATPIIAGRISAVSADAFLDERTQSSYYFVDVMLIEEEMQRLGAVELLPGMPVEAYIETESRTPASYVLRPIASFFGRAFRD